MFAPEAEMPELGLREQDVGGGQPGYASWTADVSCLLICAQERGLAEACVMVSFRRTWQSSLVAGSQGQSSARGRIRGQSGWWRWRALRSLERPVQDTSQLASPSTFLHYVPQRTHPFRKAWANTQDHPEHPSPRRGQGLASCPASILCGSGCAPPPLARSSQGEVRRVGFEYVMFGHCNPQETLRGREGGGNGMSEHQLCMVMHAGCPPPPSGVCSQED